jgi:hypothetical protein
MSKEIDIFELAKARLSRVEEYEKKLNEEKVALALFELSDFLIR